MKQLLVFLFLLPGVAFAQTDTLRAKVDSLFTRATTREQKFQNLVEPARKTLREMPAAIPYLVEKLNTHVPGERVALVFFLLGKMPEAVIAVSEATQNPNRDVVKNACEILGELKDRRATPHLLKVLNHPDILARGNAATAIGKCGGAGAKKGLLKALQDSVNFVRTQATAGLGYLQDTSAIQKLIPALKDEYYGVRFAAANSLAKFKNASLPYLYRALESEKPMVRQLAAEALGKLKAPDVVTALFRLLKSTDWPDRLAAIEALAQLDTPEAKKLLFSHVEKEPLVKARMEELLKK